MWFLWLLNALLTNFRRRLCCFREWSELLNTSERLLQRGSTKGGRLHVFVAMVRMLLLIYLCLRRHFFGTTKQLYLRFVLMEALPQTWSLSRFQRHMQCAVALDGVRMDDRDSPIVVRDTARPALLRYPTLSRLDPSDVD